MSSLIILLYSWVGLKKCQCLGSIIRGLRFGEGLQVSLMCGQGWELWLKVTEICSLISDIWMEHSSLSTLLPTCPYSCQENCSYYVKAGQHKHIISILIATIYSCATFFFPSLRIVICFKMACGKRPALLEVEVKVICINLNLREPGLIQ